MDKDIQTYDEKLLRAVADIKEAILQGQYEACMVRKYGADIDPFRTEQRWDDLKEADIAILKNTVAPLLVASGDEMAMKLDVLLCL